MPHNSRYFFYGAPLRADITPSMSIQERLMVTGGNTGNVFIAHAVEKQLGTPREAVTIGTAIDVQRINREYEKLVIPASNFLNSYSDWSGVANIIRQVKIPVVVIGLGSQASQFTDKIELKQGTFEFLKLLADRSVTLGVRGNFTAERLFDIGITNVDVIGCPTIFSNCTPSFRAVKPPLGEEFKPAINFGRRVENLHLLEMAMANGYPLIAQSEELELALMDGAADAKDVAKDPLYRKFKTRRPEEIAAYFKAKTRVFYDMQEWISAVQEYDFVVGPRLHGNMIAFQHGVPALWIAHDTRTAEICNLAKFPSLAVGEIFRFKNLREFYEHADFEEFNQNYPSLYGNYVDFLERNGLEHFMEKAEPAPGEAHNQLHSYYQFQQAKASLASRAVPPGTAAEAARQAEGQTPASPATVSVRRFVKSVAAQSARFARVRSLYDRLKKSPLFDPQWYYETYLRKTGQDTDPLLHYLETGWKLNNNPGPLFDVSWYRENNKDVLEAGIEPLQHYLSHGWKEHRDPSPLFSIAWYFRRFPDAAKAGVEPLGHYLTKGWRKGFNPNPFFNGAWYRRCHPDVAVEPFTHYLKTGWKKGFNPSSRFNSKAYLQRYPDVAAAGMEPLTHYLRHGKKEGRQI